MTHKKTISKYIAVKNNLIMLDFNALSKSVCGTEYCEQQQLDH